MNREAERKRLVELLKAMNTAPEITCPRFNKQECKGCQFDKGNVCDVAGREADYLLNNGIIVPPVKVGQTLYWVRQDTQKIIEVVVTAIMQRKTFQYAEIDIGEDNRKSFITLAYWEKRLFPTREEAQKALEGSEK